MPAADDVRRDTPHWDYFDDDAFPTWSARVEAIRAALTSDGRTLAQGALAWIWARTPVAIPIPGFRTVAQIEENAARGRRAARAGRDGGGGRGARPRIRRSGALSRAPVANAGGPAATVGVCVTGTT